MPARTLFHISNVQRTIHAVVHLHRLPGGALPLLFLASAITRGLPMMPSRPDILRNWIPYIAAVLGFIAGLAAGGFAEALIVPLALFVTGHSHPLSVLDESFHSYPPGLLALATIAGYLTTAFLGAIAAYKTARRFSSRWSPPGRGRATSPFDPIRNVWRQGSREKKALLVALPLLALILQTVSVRERQAALRIATYQATPAKSAPLADRGRILYTTSDEKRKISRWEIVSFLATFGTLAYLLHVFRLKDLVSQALAMHSASPQDRSGQNEPKKP